jgi:hypothetical protein
MSKSKKRNAGRSINQDNSTEGEAGIIETAESTLLAEEIPVLDDIVEASQEAAPQKEPAKDPKKPRRRTVMGHEVTYVPQEKLLAVVEQMGLSVEEKKVWLKIAGPSGARVYLPKRKDVARVDIADMTAPEGTSIKLGGRSFGAVKEQLDMQGTEEQILERFRAVLSHMQSLPPAQPKAKRDVKSEQDDQASA